MAIATELETLKTNITNAYNSINTKGGTIPTNKNTENLSSAIESIPSGEDLSEYFMTTLPSFIQEGPFSPFTLGIKKIPPDLTYPTNFAYLFHGLENLTDISAFVIDTEDLLASGQVTNCYQMFGYCRGLSEIPLFNTSNITRMGWMFLRCSTLTTIPLFDMQNVTDTISMFNTCINLVSIPSLNTSNVIEAGSMFYNCYKLTTIPLLDFSKVQNVYNIFQANNELTNVGGFQNLGQAYLTTTSANNSNYSLSMILGKLTEQSMINVLNNLYDIATKGCKTQTVRFGTNNLAKLTSEEGQQALTNAQTKGWTIS